MFEEQESSTVTDSEQTPASVEVVDTTESSADTAAPASTPGDPTADDMFADPWENAKAPDDEADTTDKPETPEPDAQKPASDEKKEADPNADPDDVSKVLDELFKPEDEQGKNPEDAEDEEGSLDKQDPEAMIAAQRNATARAWATRNEKWAKPIKAFRDPNVPIAEVAEKIAEIHPERYGALSQHAAHELVDANPDATFQRAYVIKMLARDPSFDPKTATLPSLDDIVNGSFTQSTQAETPAQGQSTAPPTGDLAELTAELDDTLEFDWRDPANDENFYDDREKALAKALRGMEAQAKAASDAKAALEKDLEGVKTAKTTEAQQAEQQILQEKLAASGKQYRDGIANTFFPRVFESTGLVVSENDTPEIKAFKEARQELYTGTPYEQENNLDSAFEVYAYNESTVKGDLEAVVSRIVDAQLRQVQAEAANKAEDARRYQSLADDEKIPLFQLLAQANKEFRAKRIDPDLALLSAQKQRLAQPITEASQRVEIVSNGAGSAAPSPRPQYETAEDVWEGGAEEVRRSEALRAGA